MRRPPHVRLKDLRVKQGYKTQKHFCADAQRRGFYFSPRRYSDIERGDVTPKLHEITEICRAMNISADAWLLGRFPHPDVEWLTEAEMNIVRRLLSGLKAMR